MKYKLIMLGVLFFLIPATSASSFETISAFEAYEIVTTDANAFILDVRTIAEWKWVGHPGANKLADPEFPDLEGFNLIGKVVNISSRIDKKGQFVVNRSFLSDVNEFFQDYPDVILITMCRSGPRAAAAAQTLEDNGYNVKSMGESFSGSADERGYRTINGWVNSGLPYSYTGAGYQD